MLTQVVQSCIYLYCAGVITFTAIGAGTGAYSELFENGKRVMIFEKDKLPFKDGIVTIDKEKVPFDLYNGALFGFNYGLRWPYLITDTSISFIK